MRRMKVIAIVVLLALCTCAGAHDAAAADLKSLLASPVDVTVYSAESKMIAGHGHYTIKQDGPKVTLIGNTHYLSGERDLELISLDYPPGSQLPTVRSADMTHLGSDGAPQLIEKADFHSGQASCRWSNDLYSQTYEDHLVFPADSYAGATAIVPLSYALHNGDLNVHFHIFECAPEPKVFAIDSKFQENETHWSFYPGDLAKMELSPDLGLLNLLAKPFIPTVSVWFHPQEGWRYVGAVKERFYRGPAIILVRNNVEEKRALLDGSGPISPAGAGPNLAK